MKIFKYGIIGCGAAAKVHAYHFSRNPCIECIASVDTYSDNALYFQKEFGFKKVYKDFHQMFMAESLDIVSICTPPAFHKDQIMAAAKSGVKVIAEKPLTTTMEDSEEVVEFCRKRDVPLGIMLPRRFYNNSLATKAVLEKKALGKIKKVVFNLECRKDKSFFLSWRGKQKIAGGGVLMSQAIHSIDQLVYFFGKPSCVEGRIKRTRDYIEVEDEAEGTICFENGIIADIYATTNSKDYLWKGITQIIGDKGKIVLDSAEVVIWDVSNIPAPIVEEEEVVPAKYKPIYYGPGHLKVINSFIRSLEGGRALVVDAEKSLSALKIIHGIYSSNGKKVHIT